MAPFSDFTSTEHCDHKSGDHSIKTAVQKAIPKTLKLVLRLINVVVVVLDCKPRPEKVPTAPVELS